MFLDHFDVLMSKNNFKKIKKYIILMCFRMKNTLKSNNYHSQTPNIIRDDECFVKYIKILFIIF
jgi:hypothetical protein